MTTGPDESAVADPGPTSAETQAAVMGCLRLLRQHQAVEQAAVLARMLKAGQDTEPTVVVAGEVTRGKSELVNALTGVPGLSPVGDRGTTGVAVRVVPPDAERGRAAGDAVLLWSSADGATRRPVPAADVASWVAVDGEHRTSGDGTGCEGVEVTVESLHLPGVVLVDTPGSGGLDSAHTRLAVLEARRASLLLFVADGGQRLTAPELEFLRACTRTVHRIVIAVTKVDRYPRGWREVMAENVALLAEHLPDISSGDVVPVASPVALRAAVSPGPRSAALLDASGVPALATALLRRTGEHRRLVAGNVLHVAAAQLTALRTSLATQREAVAGSSSAMRAMESEQAALEDLTSYRTEWTLYLDRDLQRVRRAVTTEAETALDDLTERWTHRVQSRRWVVSKVETARMTTELASELRLVGEQAQESLRGGLARVVRDMYDRLPGAEAMTLDVDTRVAPVRIGTAVVTPGMAGMLMPIAMAVPLAVINPAILISGLMGAAGGMRGAVSGGQQMVLSMLRDGTQRMRVSVQTAVTEALTEVKPDLVIGFRTQVETSVRTLKASIAEAQAAARADADSRQRLLDQLDRHLRAVDVQLADAREVLDRLRDT